MGKNELDLQNMSETLSESSWKSKDVFYFATTSKNMSLEKKTKQQQRAMTVVWQTSHCAYMDPGLHIKDLQSRTKLVGTHEFCVKRGLSCTLTATFHC